MNLSMLPEVISKESFLLLIKDLISKKQSLPQTIIIESLSILGEKFEKFYDLNVLGDIENDEIYQILKKFTDFNQLDLMENLIGIMFQFRINKYNDYLISHLNDIELSEVYREVFDAVNEYRLTK